MNLPIELLVFLFIIGFVILWFFLMLITKYWKLWRYKPENDKGRRAEEGRRNRLAGVQGSVFSERRSVFQATNPNPSRQDSPSGRTPSSSSKTISNPFRRK